MGASECRCAKEATNEEDKLTLFHCANALADAGRPCGAQEQYVYDVQPQELTALTDRPLSPSFGNGENSRHPPMSARNRSVLPGGATYEGEWLEVPASADSAVASSPSRKATLWQKHGQGTLVLPDGMRYCGQFMHDRKSGYGTLSYPSGCSYGGQWSDDLQRGHGSETWADGSFFEGQFKSGEKQGKGRFLWGNGCHYEGEFSSNDMHGEGTYSWTDSRVYAGQWRTNVMGPSGTMQWPDGRVYTGAFAEGRKQGEGTHWWPDGRSYRGQWRNGKQHGKGLARTIKGVECEGTWEDGKFVEWTSKPTEALSRETENSVDVDEVITKLRIESA